MDYIRNADYDAIILDIMLPDLNGIEILKEIRKNSKDVPILLLTAKGDLSDKVEGLNSGADDYLVKPFAFEELIARLRAITRRKVNNDTNQYCAADLVMDVERHTIRRGEKRIHLSSKEFAILEYLIMNKGIVLTRNKIEQHIWNYEYEGASNMVDVYIRYLRRKIDDHFEPKLIHTVRGVGYVLKEEAGR